MTDLSQTAPTGLVNGESLHTSDAARKRLAKRYSAELRFKLYGVAAVCLAGLFLVLLLSTIVGKGLPAFTFNYLTLPLNLGVEKVDPNAPGKADYNGILRDGLKSEVPFAADRRNRRVLYGLISSGANVVLRKQAINDPGMLGGEREIQVPLSDFADLYVKGLITKKEVAKGQGIASPVGTEGTIKILSTSNDFREILAEVKADLRDQAAALRERSEGSTRSLRGIEARISALKSRIETADALDRKRLQGELESNESAQISVQRQIDGFVSEADGFEQRADAADQTERMTPEVASYLIHINGGVVKVASVDTASIEGEVLVPLSSEAEAKAGEWTIERLDTPESNRKFSDKEIAYIDYLEDKGLISNQLNTIFFTYGASREPEMAGIWGAVVGSFFTMAVTLALSFPIGVAAAIYLEEFAPKNRFTHLIEVNINNLAAVPSIVFGLLGLAVFLNIFGMPRSAPVVGGLVLALMTLPTIIIAARAALKAVPPSIREAALGVGASRLQAVFHHVLPLAMPGIFTGTIIGMAQALGETAPLLMIGMVAFIVDIPGGPLDPSTVLPVQIYMWADFPEPAFQQKTSAAIMVLLGFLIAMNAIAIVLRKRFERRW